MVDDEREEFLPSALRQDTSFCAAVAQLPLHAAQQFLQCFGYAQSVRLLSGRTVTIGKEIAQGGYSFVYVAREPLTGNRFALKKMLCQTEEQVAQAKEEISIHKSFDHDHLMPLLDYAVVSSDNQMQEFYLLFPLMENGSLRNRMDVALQQVKPIPETEVLDLFLKICRAVAELHSHSPPLAHRDIKPENVLLSEDYEPMLTDFGSVTDGHVTVTSRQDALLLQEQAAQHSSMPYRAPELYDVPTSGKVTPRTDVWSLGCLLYAMAFGYSPFECTILESGEVRVTECTYLAVIGPIKFPSRTIYTESFIELIRWMLTQDASARPSVFDVIDRLDALLA